MDNLLPRREGDWCKETGAHCGVVWTGRRWQSFECLTCMSYFGRTLRRVPMNAAARKVLAKKKWDMPCCGFGVHAAEMLRQYEKEFNK